MTDFLEFEESEIVFSKDFSSSDDQNTCNDSDTNSRTLIRRSKMPKWKKESYSVPVNIPATNSNSSSPSSFRYDDGIDFDGHFSDDEIVPPHVIVDRRSMDFNTYEEKSSGNRRKKLIYVRNSILKLTGFLES
ncbi:protein S40-1-like [Amaranthus tricolor]|uniref:protein S40-1-like n=1 Tax=Amaranthus tricolor TaxID=29722 RepID=UPI00258DF11C|nr:protein S40-1-like [Amaranthus tricolor]